MISPSFVSLALAGALTISGLALADAGIDMYDVVIGCGLRQQADICLIDPTLDEEMTLEADNKTDLSFGRITLGFMPALQQVAALVQEGDLDATSLVTVSGTEYPFCLSCVDCY